MSKFRVLALDGGGIRGLLTIRLLQRLCRDSEIADLFDSVDLIAGTSSGGLIALAMAHGLGPLESPPLPMVKTLEHLEQVFEHAEDTFGPGIPWWLGGTLLWPKYGTAARERAFKKAVGEATTLGQLRRKVLVAAFDIDNEGQSDGEPDSRKWKPKLFHNFKGECSDQDALVYKVALYTSALPAYFPTVDGYIDGGVYANNPSMCALAQVLDPRYEPTPKPALSDVVMLSIGAGLNLKFIKGQALKWGVFRWGVKYVDLTVDSTVGIADYQCKHLLGPERYCRVAPEFKPDQRIGSDDLGKVDELRRFADEVRLDKHIEWLKRNWIDTEARAKPPRQKEKTSKHILNATELTCLAPIREGFVGVLDTRTYATRLRIVMRVLHALRVAAREARAVKTVSDMVDAIRSIHSFHFAILGERQLLLTVSFAGAWEPYMRIIWRDLGPLMDLVLCNCKDYVESSSDKGFERFAAYIRQQQVESEFFYPESGLSVDDQRYLADVERLVRRGGAFVDTEIAGLTVENTVDAVMAAAKANENEAREQANMLLRVLGGLRDVFPETDPDRVFLDRATVALLKNSILPDAIGKDDKAGLALTPEQQWFKTLLEKEAAPVPQVAPALHPRGVQPLRQRTPGEAIQGGMLKPYKTRLKGRSVPATHGCLLLARITDPAKARQFLRLWKDKLTVEPDPGASPGEPPYRNIAFTFNGLRQLGVPETTLAMFPKEFREGMEARAGLLGDVRCNHPDNWVLPEWNVNPPPVALGGEVPRVRISTIDLVVQMRAVDPDGPDDWTPEHPLYEAVSEFCEQAGLSGIKVLSLELMRNRVEPAPVDAENAGFKVRDHFGFVEGISQPTPDQPGRDHVRMGELLVGYENDRHDPAFPDANAIGDGINPLGVQGSILDNGTFLVIRKLAQHADRLYAVLNDPDNQKVLPPDQILASMMGRTKDGDPLADPVRHGGPRQNDFDYAHLQGDLCPLHAHIRRANPRTGTDTAPVPRIMRRGMSYGPKFDPAHPDAAERGMFFMAYNASIAEQFEVIQRWISGGNSTGVFSGHCDPLAGVPDPSEPDTFRFRTNGVDVHRVKLGTQPFVTLKWGMYLFVPSIAAIGALAGEPPDGGKREMLLAAVKTGQDVMQRLQTSNDWAAVYEDVSAIHSGVTAAVSTAIRMLHGGVRRTPYGVIVASEPLVMQVLGDDRRFSVSEYRKRMDASIGQIYLGLDAGDDYQRLSTAANAAIEKISALDAFNAAWGETTAALMGLVGHQKVPASFSLEQLADETLARLSKYWLDIPDGRFVISGGRPLPGDAAPRCPFHSLPPSRYIFSSPQPRLAVAAMGTKSGNLLLKGVKEFVEAHRDKHARAQLKGELSIALFKAMGEDRDELARNLVGVLEGFLPTVFGNFLKVTNLWTSDELQTLWRLQQELCAKADADYHHARSVLERPLHEAMMKRPIPDILYRTATKEVLLGDLRVRAGERVVLSIAAATQEMLGGGKISVAPVFGGLRSQAVHPTHACPGYEMAMGVMLGMLAALLQAGTLAPGAHPFMNLGDPKPFFVKRPKEAVAVP